MANALTVCLQNLFFPGLKVPVKSDWRLKLQRDGFKTTNSTIPRADGQLAITVIEPETLASDKLVILAHPVSRKARHFFGDYSVIDYYIENNYRIILFDFNGFGESSRIDMYYWKDAEEVVRWCTHMGYQTNKLVLHGTSFGAFHVVRAARALPPGSTLLLENVSRTLYDYWKRWKLTGFAAKILPSLPYQSFKDMEIRSILKSDLKHINVVFIGCQRDRYTPIGEMRDLAKDRNHDVAFLEFNCDHLEAYKKFPDDYKNQLDSHLENI